MLASRERRPVVDVIKGERVDANAAAVLHLVAQRWEGRENVAEDDGGVDGTVPVEGLHRDVGAEVKVLTALPKRVLGGEFSVLGKVAARLAHEPHRGAVDGLAVQSGNDPLFAVHAVNSMCESASSIAATRPRICPSS